MRPLVHCSNRAEHTVAGEAGFDDQGREAFRRLPKQTREIEESSEG
jgi:hypothetical protein